MNEPIILRGGVVLLPAEVTERDALMPALNEAIVASQAVTR